MLVCMLHMYAAAAAAATVSPHSAEGASVGVAII